MSQQLQVGTICPKMHKELFKWAATVLLSGTVLLCLSLKVLSFRRVCSKTTSKF